jgi:hypothetical protein
MQWRVKLSRAPRQKLQYYFLQSTMDPSEVKNLQNVEETTLHTPANAHFDATLQVQLTIRPDGTAVPRFVYRSATTNVPEIGKDGKKFFVDMTDASGASGEAYVGLDFGTSNTAISYIDRAWVQLIETRSHDAGWKELGELVELLPSPLAIPLARFIGDHHLQAVVPPGYSFLEAGLCLAAYISYIELCSTDRRAITRFFSNFPHRSASYLWRLLGAVQVQLGKNSKITAPYKRLCIGENAGIFERITKSWSQVRHELIPTQEIELLTAVRLLANVSHEMFSRTPFGLFQNVQKEPFASRYYGRFRLAHGKPPHVSYFSYAGPHSFSEAEAFVASPGESTALPLAPLVFWYSCPQHRDLENGHCFFFDKLKGEGNVAEATFKAANYNCQLTVTAEHRELSTLLSQLLAFHVQDPRLVGYRDIKLSKPGGTLGGAQE